MKHYVATHWFCINIVILVGLFGILIGALINAKGEELGSWADWISGIGTVAALFFAYNEIINSRKQFEKEHESKLQVYSSWKDSAILKRKKNAHQEDGNTEVNLPGLALHIVPVNVGLSDGVYRYFGICKNDDLKTISEIMFKIKNNNASENESSQIIGLVCCSHEDLGENDNNFDITGMRLLFPDNKEVFQSIKSNNVGKIENKSKKEICNKLGEKAYKEYLVVLYTDPSLNLYSFDVRPYEKVKTPVTMNLPDEK